MTTRMNFRGLGELIEQLPAPQPEQPPRTIRDAWGTPSAASTPAAAPPAAPALGHFRVTINDVTAMKELDPLLNTGAIIMLATPRTDAVSIGRPDGGELFTIQQVDPDSKAGAVCASGDVVDAIYQGCGVEPTTTPRSDHVDAARAWAQEALLAVPHHDLAVWRREPEGLRMLVADRLAHSFALPPEVVAQIAGAPSPSRTLWHGEDAERLDAARRAREEEAAEKAKAAAAVHVEAVRDRTFAELGITAVGVKVGRLGDGTVSPRVFAGTHQWMAAEPWSGAAVLYRADGEVVYGFRSVPGVAMPRFARDGVRAVEPSTIAPREVGEVVDASPAAMQFLADRKREAGEDFGAVQNLQAAVWPAAAALIAKSVRALLSPSPMHSYKLALLAEQLVRSSDCRLRPDAALHAVLGHPALDGEFRRLHPPIEVPVGVMVHDVQTGAARARPSRSIPTFTDDELPSRALVGVLGAALVKATQAGVYVPAGAPLEPEPWPAPTDDKASRAKKTKKED